MPVRRIALILELLACLGAHGSAQAVPAGARSRVVRLEPITGLDEFVPTPRDNPITGAKAALGVRLFFDTLLSSSGRISCANCHSPARAFSDSTTTSRGATGHAGRRNTPALVNRAWGTAFFWDGRAATLEEQVVQPIQDTLEMNLPLASLLSRLRADREYRTIFAAAFDDGISVVNVGRALATFVRTIRSGNSAVDRYMAGDFSALALEARRGLALFTGRANCSACHAGPNLTDEQFHNTGVSIGGPDSGRFGVTRQLTDVGKFKTPSLREVARTGPFMHDGSLATLEDVVDFYSRGGNANAHLDRQIRPLDLTAQDRSDLVALLNAFTGTVVVGLARN